MLNDDLFQDTDAVFLQPGQECFRSVLPVVLGILLDAGAAGSFQGLADQFVETPAERVNIFCGCVVINPDPPARNPLLKEFVEFRFVIKCMPVFLRIHPADNIVGNTARDDRFALFIVQLVHLRDFVVNITRVVFDAAFEHIGQKPQPSLPAAFFQQAGCFPHGFPVHFFQAVPEILNT